MFRCINSAATPPAQQHVKVDHTPPLVPTTMGSGAGNKVQVKACNQLRMVKAMQQERSRSILERNAAVFRKQQPEKKRTLEEEMERRLAIQQAKEDAYDTKVAEVAKMVEKTKYLKQKREERSALRQQRLSQRRREMYEGNNSNNNDLNNNTKSD